MFSGMNDFAKTLIFAGLFLAAVGLLLFFCGKIPGIGRLPGDIYYRKGDFVFFFPLATCLLGSAVLTFVLMIFGKR